jgi:predicted metalloprotease
MRLDIDPDMSQVEDRRGVPGGGMAVGGGLGVVGLIVVVLMNLLGGGGGAGYDVNSGLNQFPAGQQQGGAPLDQNASQADQDLARVVTHVQRTWDEKFQQAGRQYEKTQIVLFTQGVQTACGSASSAVGPFYCPGDRKVYLDQSFFKELETRFGAGGDFAEAYVIAHEFGHHVQTVLGIEPQVRKAQQEDPDSANELSVRMELQADCLAGVWANVAYAEGNRSTTDTAELSDADISEALTAAEAIGDDRLQQRSGGEVNPAEFTHGTSEQRQTWFTKGFKSGAMDTCDTFKGDI